MLKRVVYITSTAEPYFTDQIFMRAKTWELRLNKGAYREVEEGDLILNFKKDGTGEFSLLEIVKRREFPSFREALEALGYKNAIPHASSLEEAVAEYRKFYSEEDERGYGVVAFKVEPVAVYKGEITWEDLEAMEIESFVGGRR